MAQCALLWCRVMNFEMSNPRSPGPGATFFDINRLPSVGEFFEWGSRAVARQLSELGRAPTHVVLLIEPRNAGVMIPHDPVLEACGLNRSESWARFREMTQAIHPDMLLVFGETWAASLPRAGNRDDLPADLSTYDLSREEVIFNVQTPSECHVRRYELSRLPGLPVGLGKHLDDFGRPDFAESNMLNILYRHPGNMPKHGRPN